MAMLHQTNPEFSFSAFGSFEPKTTQQKQSNQIDGEINFHFVSFGALKENLKGIWCSVI
jgi:hypothetical protein